MEIGKIRNTEKYSTVMICPVRMNGISTGRAPIQVSIITRFRVTHIRVLENV